MPFVSVKSETLNEEKAGEIGYVGIENGIEIEFLPVLHLTIPLLQISQFETFY